MRIGSRVSLVWTALGQVLPRSREDALGNGWSRVDSDPLGAPLRALPSRPLTSRYCQPASTRGAVVSQWCRLAGLMCFGMMDPGVMCVLGLHELRRSIRDGLADQAMPSFFMR